MHNEAKLKAGKELACKVLSLNQICDKSKIGEVELERLTEMVIIARSMFIDSGEYVADDDCKAFL